MQRGPNVHGGGCVGEIGLDREAWGNGCEFDLAFLGESADMGRKEWDPLAASYRH